MAEITFNIKVTMKDRWVNDFCTMLKYMESCGRRGHSAMVGFYADGDGDFRPKFEIDREFEMADGIKRGEYYPAAEVVFDAG